MRQKRDVLRDVWWGDTTKRRTATRIKYTKTPEISLGCRQLAQTSASDDGFRQLLRSRAAVGGAAGAHARQTGGWCTEVSARLKSLMRTYVSLALSLSPLSLPTGGRQSRMELTLNAHQGPDLQRVRELQRALSGNEKEPEKSDTPGGIEPACRVHHVGIAAHDLA